MVRSLMKAMALLAVSWPVMAAAPASHALKGLEAGEWELRERGAEGETRRLCLSDLRQLLQVRHARNSCKSFTVSETPSRSVITYDCGGAGSGRTDLRIETPRLVQIYSQGIAEGAPFALMLEARWAGACR